MTTHIDSRTFIGAGTEPSVLVVTKDWREFTPTTINYELEAWKLRQFLTATFCNKTLEELKKVL